MRARTRGGARRGMLPTLVAVALVLAACGSDTDSSAPATTAGTTDAANTTEGPCVPDPAALIASAPSPAATSATLPSDLVADLDSAAREAFDAAAAPGAVVAVRTPDGTWIQAYGEADPGAGTAMAPGVHTRVGSVTKTFTVTLVLQLAEEGGLSLDDVIDDYVEGIPNGDRITLRQLADMTSGIASYTRSEAFTDVLFTRPETTFTPDELVAFGVAESPLFEPGADFDYSNTNTVLLGLVVEQITGQPVEDVLRARILEPLGLSATSWPGADPAMPEPFARGYTLQGGAPPDDPSDATNWNPSWGWTAGELISTIDDLLVYGRALATGQGLLGSELQTERLASVPGPAGYGIGLFCIGGWVGHDGTLPGYNTSVFHHATAGTTLIVQTNSDIASGTCTETPVLAEGPAEDEVCMKPADRVFVGVAEALGYPFEPAPLA